jgi:hypothetical protein
MTACSIRRSRLSAAAVALLLAAGGCGDGELVSDAPGVRGGTGTAAGQAPAVVSTTAPSNTAASPSEAPAPDRSSSILPSVRMTDVRTGGSLDLVTLVPAERPVLLWFWAPH